MLRLASACLLVAALAAGCSESSKPAKTPSDEIVTAATLEGAHHSIRRALDQGNPAKERSNGPNNGIRRVVVDLECPRDQIVPCAAEGARAAALWLAAKGTIWGQYKGEPVTDLLINVDDGTLWGGFQLMGALPSEAALASLDEAATLRTFYWNGAGQDGEIAVATWCDPAGQRQTPEFCQAFFADECSPVAAEEVVKACPRDLLAAG